MSLREYRLLNKQNFLFLLFLNVIISVSTVNREYSLTVTYGILSPDCVQANVSRQSSLLINGQFPGPEIRASYGDILIINVFNKLESEDLTIHFHGLFMNNTPHLDGVPYISQSPIKPNASFTHVFRVQLVGTFFYHSHVGLQAVTVFGALILENKLSQSLSDIVLMLSDWWHTDRLIQEEGLLSPTFTFVGEPKSILLNGKTMYNSSYNCSHGYHVINVARNQTYRLRIIGATTLATLNFAIAGHTLTIIEVDGNYVKPLEVSYLEVASGQRYSVLLVTNNTTDNYYMFADVRWRRNIAHNGIGILHYENAPDAPNTIVPNQSLLPYLPPETNIYLADRLQLQNDTLHPPSNADREIILTGTQVRNYDGGVRWAMNKVVYISPNSSYLLNDLYFNNKSLISSSNNLSNLTNGGYYAPHNTYPIRKNEVIDFVIQNTAALNGVCEGHPYHTHGHEFWEISYGDGEYDPNNLSNIHVIPHSIMRDSLFVKPSAYAYYEYANSTNYKKPCGWKKIRLIADNPGIWPLHCHIVSHMMMGMQIVLEENLQDLRILYAKDLLTSRSTSLFPTISWIKVAVVFYVLSFFI
ncbi:unnamed protein product [Didymodactylos carnosus]|uniref:Uncharacterized protein n=1 Tax=Didymodactylos carnosus TaxID=1234261 RepID=A0A814Z4L2_9BILA|nr:unnamed protein product [Didymodactylos carnosus]CAF4000963.1 unnamed protein product [Didymodactylos carnosus]